MEQMMTQVAAITEELTMLKGELVTIKSAHANMHQASVEQNQTAAARYTEQIQRIGNIEEKFGTLADQVKSGVGSEGKGRRSLIEPKQVNVE